MSGTGVSIYRAIMPVLEEGEKLLPVLDEDNTDIEIDYPHVKLSVTELKPIPQNLCGNKNILRWLVQVSIYVKKGKGILVSQEYSDIYKALFPVNRKLVANAKTFTVREKGFSGIKQFKSNGWLVTPVDFILEYNED